MRNHRVAHSVFSMFVLVFWACFPALIRAGESPSAFRSQIDVPLETVVTSEAITVSGLFAPTALSITNGEYEVNSSGSWTALSGTVSNGDTVKVRVTSADSRGTTSLAVLSIGELALPFAVTTQPRVTVAVSASPAGGGSAEGAGDYESPAFRRPYLEIVKDDGTVVIFRPSGGANDGSDGGGPTTGKDSGIRQDTTSATSGSTEYLMVDRSNCNPFISYPFMQWDVASLPSADDVLQVTLVSYHWIYSAYFAYPLATTTIEVQVPAGSWDESTLNWNNNPGIESTVLASAILPVPQVYATAFDGPFAIDISALYKEWKSGSRTNYGLVLSRAEPFCENGSPHLMYSSDYSGMQFHPDHVAVPLVTVSATANPGYSFVNWTEDGTEVSTSASYSFAPTTNRTLVAHFAFEEADAPASIAVPESDADGNYTVSWGASETAGATYLLQEATSEDFEAGLRTAYEGTELTASISGRPFGVTYYYRVRASAEELDPSDWVTAANGCTVGTLTLKSTVKAFKYNGASGSLSYTVTGGQPKGQALVTATTTADWIVIDPAYMSRTLKLSSKGSARGSVKYRVLPYLRSSPSSRTAVIQVGDEQFTVTQTGMACTVKIYRSSGSFAGTGGSGGFSVTAPEGCSWNTSVDVGAPWITIQEGSSGEGEGSVEFSVTSNETTKARSGKIYVTPVADTPTRRTFTVKEAKGEAP